MLNVSVDIINQRSPYQVTVTPKGALSFKSQYGLEYEVGFVEDKSFAESGVYQFYIFERNNRKFIKDDKIRETVCIIIEEAFMQSQFVMVYFCDIEDGRQAVRNKMFAMWFSEFEHKNKFTMLTSKISVDSVDYFASLVLRNDNPDFVNITHNYLTFINELSDKLN